MIPINRNGHTEKLRVTVFLQFDIVRADVLIFTAFQQKAFRNNAELLESDALIQMPCMDICRNDCVELKYPEAMLSALLNAVPDQLFADVKSPAFR